MILIDKRSAVPLYLQIAQSFIRQIVEGRIAVNTRIAGSRKLSESLGINRNTVIAAMDELVAQGWLIMKPGSGAFVAPDPGGVLRKPYAGIENDPLDIADARELNNPSYYFDDGHPDVRLAPLLALTREMSALVKTDYFHRHLNYTEEFQGDYEMRKQLSRYLRETRGINASPDRLLLTRGSIMSFHLLLSTVIRAGDNIVVGQPGYVTFNNIVDRGDGKLLKVPVDEEGMVVDALEALCQQQEIRLVYAVPHHHHPTTVRLSAKRRAKLLKLAEKYDFTILEDDYDYDFHYDSSPILPLASYASKQEVIYCGSFSKLLVPSIRLGFMVAPRHLIDQLKISRRYIDRCGDPLVERAMANLMKSGLIERHLRKSKRIYKKRRDLLMKLLNNELSGWITYSQPAGGMAIWVAFHPGIDMDKLTSACRNDGLGISHPRSYNEQNKQMTRMGFASMNEEELTSAFRILKVNVLKQV